MNVALNEVLVGWQTISILSSLRFQRWALLVFLNYWGVHVAERGWQDHSK